MEFLNIRKCRDRAVWLALTGEVVNLSEPLFFIGGIRNRYLSDIGKSKRSMRGKYVPITKKTLLTISEETDKKVLNGRILLIRIWGW